MVKPLFPIQALLGSRSSVLTNKLVEYLLRITDLLEDSYSNQIIQNVLRERRVEEKYLKRRKAIFTFKNMRKLSKLFWSCAM